MKCVDSDNMRTSYVGALETGGWTVLIQLWTVSIALSRPLLSSLSQATEVVSIHRNVHATDYFVYVADGNLITQFDLLAPYARAGSDPDRLAHMMREVGLDPNLDWKGPGVRASFPRAFALARKITSLSFSQDKLEMRLLGAEINTE